MVSVISAPFYSQNEEPCFIVNVCNVVLVKVNIARIGSKHVRNENKVGVDKDFDFDLKIVDLKVPIY